MYFFNVMYCDKYVYMYMYDQTGNYWYCFSPTTKNQFMQKINLRTTVVKCFIC